MQTYNKTHGASKTKLYRVWASMKQRCDNPKHRNYRWYGAKGITYCPEWANFAGFQEWALQNGYREGLTIEREKNDLGYDPGNCTWVPADRQQQNQSYPSALLSNPLDIGMLRIKSREEFKQWMEGLARQERRSLASLIEVALIEYAERHNWQAPPPARMK